MREAKKSYFKNESNIWEITVEQDIDDITPDMFEWWMNNINTSERYKLWHPENHKTFEWTIHPSIAPGGIGSVHRVEEWFGVETPALYISWADPSEHETHFTHQLVCPSWFAGMIPPKSYKESGCTIEWEKNELGIHMKTVYYLPADFLPEEAAKGLAQHDNEEMQNLPKFLPELYKKEKLGK
ncbi:DAPG hydrolase family protein [Paenibacillus polymyxa]|uniref:DAPG hydrolase family protein n=1 Tax=Paenibacillus polymyxa TaxID=1406 RepID=UPI002AB39275|nr:hypothetical protein [Paenibacillus polymyxa]MDY8022774.1 hypothetical protein [Paenibacillus polymyxa]